jgi:hypothetical protein
LVSSLSPSPINSSKSSDPGLIFHIRTCPSRQPVATRWYERPHEGAHDTEVIAEATMVLMMPGFEGEVVGTLAVCGLDGSADGIDDDVLKDALIPADGGIMGGDELRVRRVVERRAFNCII